MRTLATKTGTMKIDPTTRTYLNGERFSEALVFPFGTSSERGQLADQSRFEVIEERVRNQRVLHLGCCDHLSLIERKRAAGVWLHDRLLVVAAHCVGFDIDAEAVDYLKTQLGLPGIYVCDLETSLPSALADERWDWLVAGDILEHVDSPVAFLRNVAASLDGRIDRILVTVPNALRWDNARNVFRHREAVNSDHRYWFTPYTLAKVLAAAGYRPLEVTFARYGMRKTGGRLGWLRRLVVRRYPAFLDTLVATAAMPSNPA